MQVVTTLSQGAISPCCNFSEGQRLKTYLEGLVKLQYTETKYKTKKYQSEKVVSQNL